VADRVRRNTRNPDGESMKNKISPDEYRKKWGIPNWKNPTEYPDNVTDELWRWEFLRRHDEYRRDWEREHAITAEWYKTHTFAEWRQQNLDAPNGPIEPGNFDCDPASEKFVVYAKHSIKKYRMPCLCNPAVAKPRGAYSLFAAVGLIEGTGHMFIAPGTLLLEIDPMSSLEEHIRILKFGLKRFQMATGRASLKPHKREWADYLRILDAKGTGATNAEIWRHFRPNQISCNEYSQGRDLVRAAIRTQKELTVPLLNDVLYLRGK
jgi:hypothetical protein